MFPCLPHSLQPMRLGIWGALGCLGIWFKQSMHRDVTGMRSLLKPSNLCWYTQGYRQGSVGEQRFLKGHNQAPPMRKTVCVRVQISTRVLDFKPHWQTSRHRHTCE
eukprot:1156404-Pelagomonas_calceolata.AAC.2